MSATDNGSTVERTTHRPRAVNGFGPDRRARWSGINIAAMVVGFVVFWPLGMVVLFWILGGRDVRDLPGAARRQWVRMFGEGTPSFGRRSLEGDSGNRVFEAFQQTQHDRINEIREEIRERARRFRAFRDESRRRADEEEFERFMASAPDRSEG